jgi:hypothetical protein
MRRLRYALALAALWGVEASAQVANPPEGVEVLARGPVHEAFAEPYEAKPVATPVLDKEPPPPVEESPPDQRPEGDNVSGSPATGPGTRTEKTSSGSPGFWRVPPPERVWVPGTWYKVDLGFQWVGGFWAPVPPPMARPGQPVGLPEIPQVELNYLPEPPPSLEAGPSVPAPSEAHLYVPGCWVHQEERFRWRAGYWIEARPEWIWTPAHYRWTPAGYVFIDGYWDYPIANRGILFSPVYIPQPVYAAPQFVYTPTYCVRHESLFGAMFVRRGFGSYYFGDYFANSYVDRGFFSFNITIGRDRRFPGGFGYDPIFTHYRTNFRQDPFWNRDINDLYAGRYSGTFFPPPRTLVQQTTVVNNIRQNNTTVNNIVINNQRVTNINNIQMVTPLSQVTQVNSVRTARVDAAELRVQREVARDVRETSQRRVQAETRLARSAPLAKSPEPAQPGATAQPAARPRTAQLAVPRAQLAAAIAPVEPGVSPGGNPGANPGANPRPARAQRQPAPPTPAGGGEPRNPRPEPKAQNPEPKTPGVDPRPEPKTPRPEPKTPRPEPKNVAPGVEPKTPRPEPKTPGVDPPARPEDGATGAEVSEPRAEEPGD